MSSARTLFGVALRRHVPTVLASIVAFSILGVCLGVTIADPAMSDHSTARPHDLPVSPPIQILTAQAREKLAEIDRMLATQGTGTAAKQAVASGIDNTAIRRLNERRLSAITRSVELESRHFGPKHPEIVKLELEIVEIERDLSIEADAVLARFKASFEAAAALPNAGVAPAVQQSAAPEAYYILDQTKVAMRQLSRESAVSVAGRAAAGGVCGLLLAVMLSLARENIRARKDYLGRLITRTGLDHLGSIASASRNATPPAQLLACRHVLAEPQGQLAQSIQRMARLIKADVDGKRAVIAITSARTCFETSAVASNLALQFALEGHRTLLIDDNGAHAALSGALLPGLPAHQPRLVKNDIPPVETGIMRDHATGLCFLPASARKTAASSNKTAARRGRLTRTLERHRTAFDVIIVDLGSSKSRRIARGALSSVDRVILVSGSEPSDFSRLASLANRLRRAGMRIAGFVTCDPDASVSRTDERTRAPRPNDQHEPTFAPGPERIGGSAQSRAASFDRRAA